MTDQNHAQPENPESTPVDAGSPAAAYPHPAPHPGAVQPGVAPSTNRPGTVLTACILAWLTATLGAVGLLASVSLAARVGLDGAYVAGALFIPALVIIALALFGVFTWQGQGWARIALTAVFGINAVLGLSNVGNGTPQAFIGVLLSVGAIILLWLPASNAWFAARRASTTSR